MARVFLKLTDYDRGGPIYVQADAIQVIGPGFDQFTEITSTDGYARVSESVEDVFHFLERAEVVVMVEVEELIVEETAAEATE